MSRKLFLPALFASAMGCAGTANAQAADQVGELRGGAKIATHQARPATIGIGQDARARIGCPADDVRIHGKLRIEVSPRNIISSVALAPQARTTIGAISGRSPR